MRNALVLVAEDEPQIARILVGYLEREGFRTVEAGDGEVALQHHLALKPDLVLLDVRLPRRDGLEVLTELRRRGDTPVIMVTAMGEDLDKLLALRSGADDYIVKPFNPHEVVARVIAVLRRAVAGPRGSAPIRIGELEIDLEAHAAAVATSSGRALVELSPMEFRLLAHMARAPRKAFTRAELVDACAPESNDTLDRTIDSHVSKLRRKLEAAGCAGFLDSVRGVGYRLRSEP